MRWGGVSLFAFLGWHLANFTIGKVNVSGGPTNDPYILFVDSFQNLWLTTVYLLAMAALGMHLWHGIWSAAQTLGLTNTANARKVANAAAAATAVVIAGGFSLAPIAVVLGIIK